MQVIYEDKDITAAVEIQKADITDNAGGIADSIELWFDDPKGLWPQWKPEKNHTVKLIENGFDSGLMYVDELEQQRGMFIIKALSIPQEAKTHKSKSWDKVRFMELASELASKYGFTLETYGIKNYLYERVDQFEQADYSFLAYRCMFEGYMLKITGSKIVIYDERYMENQAPVKTVYVDMLDGGYRFKSKSTDVYGVCSITSGSIKHQFKPENAPIGPVLKASDIYVSDIAEAERFSKGLLRSKNKYQSTGFCTVDLDSGLAAGNCIEIQGVGFGDGKYFCEQVIHRLADKKTTLKLRRPLEGY